MSVLFIDEYGVNRTQKEKYINDAEFLAQSKADNIRTALAVLFSDHNIKRLVYIDNDELEHNLIDNRSPALKETNAAIFPEYEQATKGDYLYFRGNMDFNPLPYNQRIEL